MAGIPTTVTDAGRTKIISNGLLANARKVAFGTGYDSTPADATGVATPYSPAKVLDIMAGHQSGAEVQVVFQQGETPSGADYSPTELAILDADDATIAYAGVSTGSLFTKSTAPHLWTFIGELMNLPPGATINFTSTVGYLVATTEVRGVGELAEDSEVATPPTDYPRLLSTDNLDALHLRYYPVTAAAFDATKRDLDNYVTPGNFLINHTGSDDWQNLPDDVEDDEALYLEVRRYGTSDSYTWQSVITQDSAGVGKRFERIAYASGGSRTWGGWIEIEATPDGTTTVKGKLEVATPAEVVGEGGSQVVPSSAIRVYDNGSVPSNWPAGVALIFERES